ncbi:MAG: GAF domain-containing sensor histidine kinase [Candidatus Zixiibacteriota bacterium]
MLEKDSERNSKAQPALSFEDEIRLLKRQLAEHTNNGTPRYEYLEQIIRLLLDFFKCDAAELWLFESGGSYRHVVERKSRGVVYSLEPCSIDPGHPDESRDEPYSDMERLCLELILGNLSRVLPFISTRGSFFSGNLVETLKAWKRQAGEKHWARVDDEDPNRSRVIIPLFFFDETIGLLHLKSAGYDFFLKKNIDLYEDIARDLAFAIKNHLAQSALRERVKELTGLYNISHLATQPGLTRSNILGEIVRLLPDAWQYPEITGAKIVFDGEEYKTDNYRDSDDRQKAPISIAGKERGKVEVVYLRKMPRLDEGPFLQAERNLINTVAGEIALIIMKKQSEEEHARLHSQLMHADRLATLGQVAAGVAHELNEPLGNILGFAQLARKSPKMPVQVMKDLDKIVAASLHSREVIKKLLLFARQMPSKKEPVKLNELVANGLYFLESRCHTSGIKLVRYLASDLPELIGDPSQLHQVLVNLVVNAIQAMPDGGTLTISTRKMDNAIALTVKDTGEGMDKETIKNIFLPFYTTKEIDEGTGLGLAVVDDIVTLHGGTIDVVSKKGEGSQFELRFPLKSGESEKEKDG